MKHVKKVTRDRAGAYAKAISEVLPEAMQIADRFHLHQNLSKAVKDALNSVIPNEILIPNIVPETDTNVSSEQMNGLTVREDKKTEKDELSEAEKIGMRK